MNTEEKVDVSSLSNVPETMLLPLYFKAKETKEKGIITDNKAIEIVAKVDYDFSRLDKDWKTQLGVAVRTLVFDDIVRKQTEQNKKLVIVNLGAGLDTREVRFPHLKWYQLDLPQSIAIRKQFFTNGSARLISKSLLDFSWMDEIEEKENVLFIAEGLFMYFTEAEVQSVFNAINKHFKHALIAFNTIHKMMLGRKHDSVDTSKAPFQWGIESLKEIEGWQNGWKKEEVFYSLDYAPKRWRWIRFLKIFPGFKNGFLILLMRNDN